MVSQVFVGIKQEYDTVSRTVHQQLSWALEGKALTGTRVVLLYEIEGLSPQQLGLVCKKILCGGAQEILDTLPDAEYCITTEFLPGQFDQRATLTAEAIGLLINGEMPLVRCARVHLLQGKFTNQQKEIITQSLVNPVESQQRSLAIPETLAQLHETPKKVACIEGFLEFNQQQLDEFLAGFGLAMDIDDLLLCQQYFQKENRLPTVTELRMLDTYWSDHCRHTTFNTHLENIQVQDSQVKKSYQAYLALRQELYQEQNRPITLMDLATIGTKALKARGGLKNLDQSEEINACSIHMDVDVNGQNQDWLLLFKNETHNHPTEIEPFGGASTCLGGAIRDPLSGRGYVYQAMRVTGAANPLAGFKETPAGKLPQRKLVVTAAEGYASYGNQIGVAAGQVKEFYHPGYGAKRMELGAVVGAVPFENVVREIPRPGDVVLLVGGKTGRDGCGGATGSSKAHDKASITQCSAEVQKGNAPLERRIQRLFRNPHASKMIRRCNDFGAGGVSVAIGELADGLHINLDAVPVKYFGLDGTEIAISESQERMAVVVSPQDEEKFILLAKQENLNAVRVALVSEQPRLVMDWQGQRVVDLSREFLNSNGAVKKSSVLVKEFSNPSGEKVQGNTLEEKLTNWMDSLSRCSQKELANRFDATAGGATVLMPYGGKTGNTPAAAMVAKLPVEGETTSCSGMAFGFNPLIAEQNPYKGAYLAVCESVAKLAASGFSLQDTYLSFQEYFGSLRNDPARWGLPFASLLGALQAQMDLGIAAIGGKDSMSGSFESLDVPPTLVSFAVAPGKVDTICSPEFKLPYSKVVLLKSALTQDLTLEPASFKLTLSKLEQLMGQGNVLSVGTVGAGGIAETLLQMGMGNRIGFSLQDGIHPSTLFQPGYGSFVVELSSEIEVGELLGETTAAYEFTAQGQKANLSTVEKAWVSTLQDVFSPFTRQPEHSAPVKEISPVNYNDQRVPPAKGFAKPKAIVPVLPGAFGEYEVIRGLTKAGADVVDFVVTTGTPNEIEEAALALAKHISQSQMLVLPSGFVSSNWNESSAVAWSVFLQHPALYQAFSTMLKQDGLVLGFGAGFETLLRLGVFEQGQLQPDASNTLFAAPNQNGLHTSVMVRTKVCSNLSPWMMHQTPGEIYTAPFSHREARICGELGVLNRLGAKGQISTQYVDAAGKATLSQSYNPAGGTFAIESLCSPDGRILGKMTHPERCGEGLIQNIQGNMQQQLFEGGVHYFAAH